MYDNVKICPNCNAEYFPHIEVCRECEVPLIRPGEAPAPPVKQEEEETHDNTKLAAIESGDAGKIKELNAALTARGMESFIEKKTFTDKSCAKKSVFILLVPAHAADESLHEIKAYWREKYPELNSAIENEDAGLCPACGYQVSAIAEECPSCGLNLSGNPPSDKDGGCCPSC